MTPEQELEAHFEAIRRLLARIKQQPQLTFAEALKLASQKQIQSTLKSKE